MQVTPEEADRLEIRLKKINGMAQIMRTQHAEVPIDYVLGVGGYNHLRISEDVITSPTSHSSFASPPKLVALK